MSNLNSGTSEREYVLGTHAVSYTHLDVYKRQPRIGAPRPRFGSIRLWRIPEFPNYLVVYGVTNQGIDVLRVLHARRNLEALLDDLP